MLRREHCLYAWLGLGGPSKAVNFVSRRFICMNTANQTVTLATSVDALPLSNELKAIFIKRGFETLGEILEKPLGLHQQYLNLTVHQMMELHYLSKRVNESQHQD